jgi:hypothetical protein
MPSAPVGRLAWALHDRVHSPGSARARRWRAVASPCGAADGRRRTPERDRGTGRRRTQGAQGRSGRQSRDRGTTAREAAGGPGEGVGERDLGTALGRCYASVDSGRLASRSPSTWPSDPGTGGRRAPEPSLPRGVTESTERLHGGQSLPSPRTRCRVWSPLSGYTGASPCLPPGRDAVYGTPASPVFGQRLRPARRGAGWPAPGMKGSHP